MRAVVEWIYDRFTQGDVEPLAAVLDGNSTWTIPGPRTDGPHWNFSWACGNHELAGDPGQHPCGLAHAPERWFQGGETLAVVGGGGSVGKETGQDASSRWVHI